MQGPAASLPTIGRYELVAGIAAGGMGSVVLARLAAAGGFQRLFALKMLHREYTSEAEFLAMFLDEARIAARIHHPNVVGIQEVGESPDHGYFLVMDYVDGFSLAEIIPRLREAKPHDRWRIIARVIVDALNGLEAAHTLVDDEGRPMEVVHRDISPQNILVGVDGIARVTDFGIARAASRLVKTTSGQVKGKFGYMSPEQVRSQPLDARSDLFSMGIVLWESITQKRLFHGMPVDVVTRIASGTYPSVRETVPDTPADLVAVVTSALSANRDERFRSARAFAKALEAAMRPLDLVGTSHEVGAFLQTAFAGKLAERRAAIRKGAHDTIVSSGPKPFELGRALENVSPALLPLEPTKTAQPAPPSMRPVAPRPLTPQDANAPTLHTPMAQVHAFAQKPSVPPAAIAAQSAPSPPGVPRNSRPIESDIDDGDAFGRAATTDFAESSAPAEVRAMIDQYRISMAGPPPPVPGPNPPSQPREQTPPQAQPARPSPAFIPAGRPPAAAPIAPPASSAPSLPHAAAFAKTQMAPMSAYMPPAPSAPDPRTSPVPYSPPAGFAPPHAGFAPPQQQPQQPHAGFTPPQQQPHVGYPAPGPMSVPTPAPRTSSRGAIFASIAGVAVLALIAVWWFVFRS